MSITYGIDGLQVAEGNLEAPVWAYSSISTNYSYLSAEEFAARTSISISDSRFEVNPLFIAGFNLFGYQGYNTHSWLTSIKAGSDFDHETESSVTVRITISAPNTNGRGTTIVRKSTTIKINVIDINEAPTDIILENISNVVAIEGIENTYEINNVGATLRGTLTATDPDSVDDVNGVDRDNRFGEYQFFLSGASKTYFKIVRNSSGNSELRLKTQHEADFSSLNNGGIISAKIIVKDNPGAAESNRLSYTETFTFIITDKNEAPTDIILTNTSDVIIEGVVAGVFEIDRTETILLGTLTGTDTDKENDINGADPNNRFGEHEFFLDDASKRFFEIIKNSNGNSELHLKSQYEGDFSSVGNGGTISATIIIKDNPDAPEHERLSYTKTFTFNIGDINEAPTDITLSNTSHINNKFIVPVRGASDSVTFGRISATDPDAANPNNRFDEYEISLDQTSSAGFRKVATSLTFDRTAQDLTYVNHLSVTILAKDNPGAPDEERNEYKEIFYLDINHELTIEVPTETINVIEDTPFVFSQSSDSDIFVHGADGATLTATLSVGRGILDIGQEVNGFSLMRMVVSNNGGTERQLILSGIDEHELSSILEGLIYTPDENVNGGDTLSITVEGDGRTITRTVNIDITPVDDAGMITNFGDRFIHQDLSHTISLTDSGTSNSRVINRNIEAGAPVLLANQAEITDIDGYTVAGGEFYVRVISERTYFTRTSDTGLITVSELADNEVGVYAVEVVNSDTSGHTGNLFYRDTVGEAGVLIATINERSVTLDGDEQLSNGGRYRSETIFRFIENANNDNWEANLKIAFGHLLNSIEYSSGGFDVRGSTAYRNGRSEFLPYEDTSIITVRFKDGDSASITDDNVGLVIEDDRTFNDFDLVAGSSTERTGKKSNFVDRSRNDIEIIVDNVNDAFIVPEDT